LFGEIGIFEKGFEAGKSSDSILFRFELKHSFFEQVNPGRFFNVFYAADEPGKAGLFGRI